MPDTEERHGSTEQHARDLELARRTLAGDRGAQAEWVRRMRCVPAIVAAINVRMNRALPRDQLAELAQDCLVTIWRRLGTFEGRATLETWAHRFCFLEYMNRLRQRRRQTSTTEDLTGDVADRAAEDYRDLESGLVRLGPPESDIIRLKHFEELTFPQIGARLGISPNTAKTHYYRGLQWLRRHLPRDGETSPR
ncbi:MAG: sigma-70 family RNA polymerase sigma factor [Planctomycetota bacterium]